nr:hypothetical protein BaRGS_001288 [Batillaria attramentaria]
MRPDEHKKKRSAQYQRKHGGGKEKGGDESKAVAKRGKPKDKQAGAVKQPASSAVAHFRFKEEQAWEEELEKDGGKDQVLMLNCDQLADSLSCLPLYTQLRLHTHIFTPDQLAEMDQVATKQRGSMPSIFTDQQQRGRRTSQDTQKSSEKTDTSHLADTTKTTMNPASVKSVNRNQGSVVTGTVQKKVSEENKTFSVEGRTVLQMPSDRLTSPARDKGGDDRPTGISDEALDNLLNAGEPGTVAAASVSSTGEGFSDKDLDDLLALDTGTAQPATGKHPSSSATTGASTAAESADLEDWLDSVLDS